MCFLYLASWGAAGWHSLCTTGRSGEEAERGEGSAVCVIQTDQNATDVCQGWVTKQALNHI